LALALMPPERYGFSFAKKIRRMKQVLDPLF